MDKLEHFLKKNQHRTMYYFTDRSDILQYVMVLSIYEGVIFMVDLKEGDIRYVDAGQIQQRFYVDEIQEFPENIREQPVEDLIRDRMLFRDSIKILVHSSIEGGFAMIGPGYILDISRDGTFTLLGLADFPDSLTQHGLFQKYDLEYFYNHKNTISQNVRDIYTRIHQNFLANLENIQKEWELFSRDPARHLQGVHTLLEQYNERNKQYDELKNLAIEMYKIWKQLSAEHDMMEVQSDPVSFDQNLQQNHKKQLLYRKLDKMKLIEKHATDLLVKLHISQTCLMFYIHIILCEMSTIRFRIDKTIERQDRIQKCFQPSALIGFLQS